MRNEITNHILISTARENLNFTPDHTTSAFVLHEKIGNSFYPIGAEVMFLGFLSRISEDAEDAPAFISAWIDWVIGAAKWASEFIQDLMVFLLIEKLSNKKALERILYLDPDLFANPSEYRIPLILRDL